MDGEYKNNEPVEEIEETEDYVNKTAKSLCFIGYIGIAIGIICSIILVANVPQGWIAGIIVTMSYIVFYGFLNGVAEVIGLLEKIHKKLQ